MPVIERTAISTIQRRPNRVSIGTSRVSGHSKRQRQLQREREEYTHAGGITHCSRCPPKRHRMDLLRFCDECKAINAARHKAGLIRPNCGPDHANNIVDPTVKGTYRGQSRMLAYDHRRQLGKPVVTAHIIRLGNGWRQGAASLDGKRIWLGPKTRSQDDAWAYAHEHVELIKEGLRYEGRL